jgi:hypothetical protein
MSNLRLALAVAALLCVGVASEAMAQKAPAASASSYVGHWTGVVDWNEDEYDGTLNFDLRADGTFSDPFGETGTWSATSTGVEIQYNSGGYTRYRGNLIAGTLIGTMETNPRELWGLFTLQRQ